MSDRFDGTSASGNEQLYRRLFHANPQPMWVYDCETLRFLAVNDAAVAHYGYSRDAFLAMTLRDIRPQEDLPRLSDDLRHHADGYVLPQRWRHRKHDGTLIDVEISAHDIEFEGRAGRLVLANDITQRLRAEHVLSQHHAELQQLVRERTAALEAARDQAQAANRAKTAFLSRMSHELRTPMNAILGFGQLLELDGSLGAKQKDRVQEIVRAGRHLLNLINDVLDLSRVESGGLALSPEPLALGELVAGCVRMTEPMAQARGLRWKIGALDGIVLRADRIRLRQVLLNLLSNAVKYNREGGLVRISAELAANDRLRLVVADSGPGIAPERISELFQPFQRLGAEFSDVEGTGIGLAIARQLTELMGGRIGAESEPGHGSRFWIELPSARLVEPPAPGSTPAGAALTAAPEQTLLYVEDNPANLKLVQQIVARHPTVRMLSAATAREGLILARAQLPSLVLLDIHLPDGDGFTLLAQLRAEPALRGTPVVALTAHAMREDEARLRAAGFTAYLSKPIDVAALDRLLQGDSREGASG